MNLPHSNGKPGAFRISARFVPNEPLDMQIKHLMKTSLQNDFVSPHALFRIAAFIDEKIPTSKVFEYEYAPAPTESAFASLRLEAAKSKAVKNKNGHAASTRGNVISKRSATRANFRTLNPFSMATPC